MQATLPEYPLVERHGRPRHATSNALQRRLAAPHDVARPTAYRNGDHSREST